MSDIELRQFVVGPLQTNCYAVISGGKALVVDPGYADDTIAEHLSDVDVCYIVCTHGHFDHVGGVFELKRATGARFAMADPDIYMAMSVNENAWKFRVAPDHDAPYPDVVLKDGDTIGFDTCQFEVIATPGHSPGGIVLLGKEDASGIAFVGDTLFAGSAGRTDLAEGDHATLMASLAHLKEVIAPETQLLCGHGDTTTMAIELAHNPFLR